MSESSSTDLGDMRELVTQALPFIQSLRDSVFRTFELDGEVHEPAIRKELRGYDRWLKKAKKVSVP